MSPAIARLATRLHPLAASRLQSWVDTYGHQAVVDALSLARGQSELRGAMFREWHDLGMTAKQIASAVHCGTSTVLSHLDPQRGSFGGRPIAAALAETKANNAKLLARTARATEGA